MTKQELREALEPFTIQVKENNAIEFPKEIAALASRWIDEGEHDGIDEAFNIWDNIVWELAQKHGLNRKH